MRTLRKRSIDRLVIERYIIILYFTWSELFLWFSDIVTTDSAPNLLGILCMV